MFIPEEEMYLSQLVEVGLPAFVEQVQLFICTGR